MCSTDVMDRVRAELDRRGTPDLLPTVAAAASFPGFSTIVDLTHVWGPEFPVFHGARQAEFTLLSTVATGGFYKHLLCYDEHTGTHMDAPAHFTEGGTTAEHLPVRQFFAPLAVVDISARAADDPDAQGTPDDLAAWERANGPLPDGAIVALHSGWEARLAEPASFVNVDAGGVQHFPGWHPDAAAWLVRERRVVGAATDTLSLDFGATTDFGAHLTFLPAGLIGIECLANLALLPPVGATVVVGAPKHVRASGGPSRVFALL